MQNKILERRLNVQLGGRLIQIFVLHLSFVLLYYLIHVLNHREISSFTPASPIYTFMLLQTSEKNAVVQSLFFATFICRFQSSRCREKNAKKKEDISCGRNCSFSVKPCFHDFRNSSVERLFRRQDIKGTR
jgi:hypothetical protein